TLAGDLTILGLTLLAAFSRKRALEGVARLLDGWSADQLLRRMAARQEPLLVWPPPGADRIVTEYPARAGARVLLKPIREIRLEDLMGRPQARWEESELQEHLSGRTVLVTGAGGSIGSELCRQIARHHPRVLI